MSIMLQLSSSLIALTMLSNVNGEVLKLTKDNFAQMTDGKSVFLKFYAPWCEHCVAMEPDFERLAADYKDSPISLVAELDCTDPNTESLCQEFEVPGYPTIYYGDPDFPEEYDGSNEYEVMAEFAKEHITKLYCSVKKVDNCSEEERALILGLQAKSFGELETMEHEVQKLVDEAQAAFDEKIHEINRQYNDMLKAHNEEIDKIRESKDFKWIQQVLDMKDLARSEEGEEL